MLRSCSRKGQSTFSQSSNSEVKLSNILTYLFKSHTEYDIAPMTLSISKKRSATTSFTVRGIFVGLASHRTMVREYRLLISLELHGVISRLPTSSEKGTEGIS